MGQTIIAYVGEGGKLVAYDTAYGEEQTKLVVNNCAKRHGWRAGARAMTSAEFARQVGHKHT